jgi:hypothetical protein
MGVYRKEEMIKTIIAFLNSRINLTIFQCILYGVIGYIMGEHLTWTELAIMFVIMFGIQFITRTKAVADGMMFRQIMLENDMETNDFLKHMKKEMDKLNNIDKKDLN